MDLKKWIDLTKMLELSKMIDVEKVKDLSGIVDVNKVKDLIKMIDLDKAKDTTKMVDLNLVQDYLKVIQNNVQWDRCLTTGKPEVCPSNLWKMRAAVGLTGLTVGYLASYAFPLYGFGDGGVTLGSKAAAWQSSIGNVAVGSKFAVLTSMGAKGTGVLLCGSVGAGLGILAALAASNKIDWCTCQYNAGEYNMSKL